MKIVIVLNLDGRNNSEVLIDCNHYEVSMTNSTFFSGADFVAQIALVNTAAGKLLLAMNAPWSESKTANVQTARNVVNYELNKLAGMVEVKANDPTLPEDKRIEIADASGMKRKDMAIPQIHQFTVSNGPVSGKIHCTAQGGANGHRWQITDDLVNFKNRIDGDDTTEANVDIECPEFIGKKIAVFHKAIIPKTETDWEGPIYIIVT